MWKNSAFARAFVREWLMHALDPRVISDHPNVCGLPNHVGFIDHRHDQAILTNLVAKHGLTAPEVPYTNYADDIGAALSAQLKAKRPS